MTRDNSAPLSSEDLGVEISIVFGGYCFLVGDGMLEREVKEHSVGHNFRLLGEMFFWTSGMQKNRKPLFVLVQLGHCQSVTRHKQTRPNQITERIKLLNWRNTQKAAPDPIVPPR